MVATPSRTTSVVAVLSTLVHLADAHLGAWTDGMFCPENAHVPVMKDSSGASRFIDPLFRMEQRDWWFQHGRGCDVAMPRGELLVPANGEFTANISDVRQGAVAGAMAAGRNSEAEFERSAEGCIYSPNMHTKSKAVAAGTAFAIAYVSSIADVTPENLVVFSVAPNTPWERLARYNVPDLAACPDDGCICAWGWVPDGCGQQNTYMQGHKCRVTNVRASGKKPGRAKAPGPNVTGPKQMIFAFQKSGNNVADRTPSNQVPTYSARMGYMSGAQTDIFDGSASTPAASRPPSSGGEGSSGADMDAPTPATTAKPTARPSPAPAPTKSPSSKPPPSPKPAPDATSDKCRVKK